MSKRNAPICKLIAEVAKNIGAKITYYKHEEGSNVLIFQPRVQDTGPNLEFGIFFANKLQQLAEYQELPDILTSNAFDTKCPEFNTEFTDIRIVKIRVEITYADA
ncbi:MAG: hypothetical protein LR008_03240 [Candidatus Pacebacteria bacterium]|nr:hypothetical protein [Candidatus Paceibacterota bacterium]